MEETDIFQVLRKCWERTGCLITADGSEDDKIKPEGLPNYQVPPPIDYVEPLSTAPESNLVIGETDENSNLEEEEEEDDEEQPSDEGSIAMDREEDRDFTDELVSMKVKVLYQNGWVVGDVEYFNKALSEYKFSLSDGTCDYIPVDDVGRDNVQVVVG